MKNPAKAIYKGVRERFRPAAAWRALLAFNQSARRYASGLALKPVTKILVLFLLVMGLTSSVWLITGWMKPQDKPAGQETKQQPTPTPRPELNNRDSLMRPRTATGAQPQEQTTVVPLETKEEKTGTATPFYTVLEEVLKNRNQKLEDVCSPNDPVARRILEDYGAIFVAIDKVAKPPACIFENEADVAKFQQGANPKSEVIGGARIVLQEPAMTALLAAREEALKQGLNITPRGGSEAARRTYDDTKRLWYTRFNPALAYWTGRGRISKEYAAQLRSMPLRQQVAAVLELEKKRIFFSKDFSKSILYSIAAPGSSQHIMMLALDVSQFGDERVRRILADYGWFQTVKSDLPHFTFIGVEESKLPQLGLRKVMVGSQAFWIPDVTAGPKQPAKKE